MKYVLIGNSFAGIFAAEAIRSQDRQGEILIIGDENERLYSRALIHEYLAGLIDKSKIYLRDEDITEHLDIELLAGKKAQKLLADRQEVFVDGEVISYDKLLIAVGGTPFIPQGIEGLDRFAGSVFTFTQLSDAEKLSEMAESIQHVVILGAGLIGMQAAEAFGHLGKNTTVVELADHILPMAVDETSASFVRKEMENRGTHFYTSDSVAELIGNDGSLEQVRLRSGKTLPADLFVIAVGVRPNVSWLADCGLNMDRGIIVNEYMQTNIDNVYAAGDCAQGLELISGSRMVLATIPIASEQGTIAGYNMAGITAKYKGGIPLNSLQFGRIQLISYGYVNEQQDQEVMSIFDENRRTYKKLVLEDNKIIGAIFLGAIDRVGLFRYLIEEKIDVSEFKNKLLSDNFGIAGLPAQIRNHLFGVRQTRIVLPETQAGVS